MPALPGRSSAVKSPAPTFITPRTCGLALAYLEESASTDEAAARMEAALRRFATALGHPEKYHHTITIFWIRMVARLLDKKPATRVLLTGAVMERHGARRLARTLTCRPSMALRLVPPIHRATHRIGLYLADLREHGLSQGEAHILAHLATSAPGHHRGPPRRAGAQAFDAHQHPRSADGRAA